MDHLIVARATVTATGVTAEGGRGARGVDARDSEEAVFEITFLMSLKDRGRLGVDFVISDAHRSRQASIRKMLQGFGQQRGRVHMLSNVLAHGPRE